MSNPRLHLMSTGEYSDYTIHAILLDQPGRDFDADCREFRSMFHGQVGGPYNTSQYERWMAKAGEFLFGLARKLGIDLDSPAIRDAWRYSNFDSHATTPQYAECLIAWLKTERGYVEAEFTDCDDCELCCDARQNRNRAGATYTPKTLICGSNSRSA